VSFPRSTDTPPEVADATGKDVRVPVPVRLIAESALYTPGLGLTAEVAGHRVGRGTPGRVVVIGASTPTGPAPEMLGIGCGIYEAVAHRERPIDRYAH
jgi:hypothetical protein